MICLGEKQELVIVKKVEFGVYLAVSFEEAAEHVLLPVKQVPEDSEVGDKLEVFVYRDSKDRIIATVNEPLLCMGKVAELTVVTVGRFGAFLDWGLEKDLLLPFREQRGVVKPGGKVLVSLYIDKSSRLCATMNVYASLRTDSPYQAEDRVRGRVYELSDNFGAFVAVDNLYSGLIAKKGAVRKGSSGHGYRGPGSSCPGGRKAGSERPGEGASSDECGCRQDTGAARQL